MKVSLLNISIIYASPTDDVYLTYSTVYKKSLSTITIPMLITVHNIIIQWLYINNYYIHYYKNVFAHNFITVLTFSSMLRVHKCACVIKFHVARLMNTKWRPI